ncbi:hypothetical protein AB5J52_01255 [Streptomyces sp. R39]|uniref:Uncharacterized protein n=1 Tax=Streptomyces sp. R39 TaxID=3238631 RepID=A0AB39QI50_9ACTN
MRHAPAIRARLAQRSVRHPGRDTLWQPAWLADAAWQVEDTHLTCRPAAEALRRTGEADTSAVQHCQALRAALMVTTGRWSELHGLLPDAISRAEAEGWTRHATDLKGHLLMVCARQGRHDQAAPPCSTTCAASPWTAVRPTTATWHGSPPTSSPTLDSPTPRSPPTARRPSCCQPRIRCTTS